MLEPNVQQIARDVYHLVQTEDSNYTCRPFNKFTPVNTTWWIIPSKKWPAYDMAKFCFFKLYDENKKNYSFFAGIHVEKEKAKRSSSKAAWEALQESQALHQLEDYLERVPHSFIELDAHVTRDDVHQVHYRYEELSLVKEESSEKEGFFQDMLKADTLEKLVHMCAEDHTLSFTWLDAYFGVTYDMKDVDAYTIYDDVIKQLEPFMLALNGQQSGVR